MAVLRWKTQLIVKLCLQCFSNFALSLICHPSRRIVKPQPHLNYCSEVHHHKPCCNHTGKNPPLPSPSASHRSKNCATILTFSPVCKTPKHCKVKNYSFYGDNNQRGPAVLVMWGKPVTALHNGLRSSPILSSFSPRSLLLI